MNSSQTNYPESLSFREYHSVGDCQGLMIKYRNTSLDVENSQMPISVDSNTTDDKNEESTESRNQLKVSLRQKKGIKKSKLGIVKKQLVSSFIPFYKALDEIEQLFLVGEVFVVCDFDNKHFENSHISYMNNFKRIQQTTIHKKNRFLQVDLEYKVPTMKYFYHSALKLIGYPRQDIHELGLLIQLYQQYCFDCFEYLIQKERANSFNLEEYLRGIEIFQRTKQQYLDNFAQDEFVFAIEIANNSRTKEFEMKSIFMSEPFLVLMGTSLEQYERYLHRFGLNEFLDPISQIKVCTYQLKQMLCMYGKYTKDNPILQDFCNETCKVEVTFHTLDGIQIQGRVICETLFPQFDNQCRDINIHPQMFIIIKYEIEPTSIQQVIQIRESQQTNTPVQKDQSYLNDIDFALEYSLQSEIFNEMAKLHNVFTKVQNRASYRYLTAPESANLKQYNVDYPNSIIIN